MKDIGKKKNGQFQQVMEGGRGDIPISSPMDHRLHPRTPPTPAPSEDRLFMDWSSIRSGSSLVRSQLQSISVGDALTSHGIEGGHETE